VKIDDFITCLLSDARGKCFACNIIDSVKIGLFPRDRLKRLMNAVLTEYEKDRANVTTSAAAIGLIYRVASGFVNKGDEKHVMAGVKTNARHSEKLAHALRSQTLTRWLDDISDPNLIPESKPPRTRDGVIAYELLLKAINSAISVNPNAVFSTDKTLGFEVPKESYIGLAWLTQETALPTLISGGDDVRDVLGLDTPVGDFQVLLVCDAATLVHQTVARPTFADGGNSRFRVIPDNKSHGADWGTTVHLGLLSQGALSVDGAPERLAEKIPLTTLKPEFRPVGWVEQPRGVSHNDSDDAFKNRLLRKRKEAKLADYIKGILA
jgi:hypothetical protein